MTWTVNFDCFLPQWASQLQLVVCIVVVLCSSHHFFLLEVLIFACLFNFFCLSALSDCLGRSCSLTNPSNRWVKGLSASLSRVTNPHCMITFSSAMQQPARVYSYMNHWCCILWMVVGCVYSVHCCLSLKSFWKFEPSSCVSYLKG